MDAFEKQVRWHQDRIYGFASYFLDCPEEAEDVTQDVLLRFWEHRHAVEAHRVRSWLLRVTRNACIDALRKRKTARGVMTVDADGVRRAASRRPSPHAEAEAADFQQHLQRALQRIDEPQRSIVILREVQQLQYQEICEALELPMSTVKVYLHRARKKLRCYLSEATNHELA